jgi:hypothetical protein
MKYQTIIDDTTTANITYICRAELWRAEDSEYWQIFIIDETWSNTEIKFPQNSDWNVSQEFIFNANDRATYTYSLT